MFDRHYVMTSLWSITVCPICCAPFLLFDGLRLVVVSWFVLIKVGERFGLMREVFWRGVLDIGPPLTICLTIEAFYSLDKTSLLNLLIIDGLDSQRPRP